MRQATVPRRHSKRNGAMLRSLVAVALLLSVLAWDGTAHSAELERDVVRAGPWQRAFPLWKDVPGSSFAVLGQGSNRGSRWEAFASRALVQAW